MAMSKIEMKGFLIGETQKYHSPFTIFTILLVSEFNLKIYKFPSFQYLVFSF